MTDHGHRLDFSDEDAPTAAKPAASWDDIPPWERPKPSLLGGIARLVGRPLPPPSGLSQANGMARPAVLTQILSGVGLVCLGGLVIWLVLGWGGVLVPVQVTPGRVLSAPAFDAPPRVTMAQYLQLHAGMSLDAAKAILGPGTEISSGSAPGHRLVMYAWQNADGSNMNAMFQNNRLVNKAQFGLP